MSAGCAALQATLSTKRLHPPPPPTSVPGRHTIYAACTRPTPLTGEEVVPLCRRRRRHRPRPLHGTGGPQSWQRSWRGLQGCPPCAWPPPVQGRGPPVCACRSSACACARVRVSVCVSIGKNCVCTSTCADLHASACPCAHTLTHPCAHTLTHPCAHTLTHPCFQVES